MGIRRRSIGGGLAYGVGEALSNFADRRVKRRELADQQTAQAQAQADKFGQTLLEKIAAEQNPGQADRLIQFAQSLGLDAHGLAPSTEQRLAPLLSKIGGESNPTQLPPDATLAARGAGIDVTPAFSLMGGSPGSDSTLPSRSYGPTSAPAVRDIAALLQAKKDQIAGRDAETGANLEKVPSFDPTTLTDVTQFLPKNQLAGRTFQQKPTPAQAGTVETQTAQAGKLSPDYVQAQTQATNALESGTRGAKAQTAGAVAGAEAAARQKVGEAPPSGLDGLASMVMSNPDLLKELTPTQRGAVLTHIAQAGGDIASQRQVLTNAMIDQAQETLTQLKTMPGMSSAVGAKGPSSFFGLLSAPIPGTEAADFVRYVDTLKSQLTLPRLDILRGMGRVTDREFRALADAVTALDRRMSEQQFKKELENIDMNLRAVKARGGTPPGPATDPAATARQKLQQRTQTQ